MSRYVSSPEVNVPIPNTGGSPRSPFLCRCIYDIPGSYCFTVPSGVSTIRVVTVGAGAASCTRVSPDVECLPSMTIDGGPDNIVCGHDGFVHKYALCVRGVSPCTDYCCCWCCGSFTCTCSSFVCNIGLCCIDGYNFYKFCQCYKNGVAGAGTTIFYEACYMSGQSIVAPSGGYADGCLTVTPGCSFAVTVGCAGGSSGFGTYISATGGSVAITQRPKVLCSLMRNACFLVCAYCSGTLVSAAGTNSLDLGNARYYLTDSNTCFTHYYENQCAQATLTPGIGTAWEGMNNVIVRSGAAGTIFHPIEYSFSACLSGNCFATSDANCSFVASNDYAVSLASTSTNGSLCTIKSCESYFIGPYNSPTCSPTATCVTPQKYIHRCWGGASAGNYFGDGINQSDYDILQICCVPCAQERQFCVGITGCSAFNYYNGPLLSCCGCPNISCQSSCHRTTISSPVDLYKCVYGSIGGAGIRSPGSRTMAGSGKSPCVCALSCRVGNFVVCYDCMDNRNGPFQIARIYPPACNCGPICCRIAQDNIDGSDYWYPEDMRGHSNMCQLCFGCLCGQPGAGGINANSLYRAGVMGGTIVHFCPGTSFNASRCPLPQSSGSCNRVCGGGTIGFDYICVYDGFCACDGIDNRCLNWTSGLVIVYY